MANEHDVSRDADRPMIYQIKVKGLLGQQWMPLFEGLTITQDQEGNALLIGPVADQAALHGILRKVRDLGMPLLSVTLLDPDRSNDSDDLQAEGGA